MNPNVSSAINELKQAKNEGLSYEQARARLLANGYTEEQLAQAAYQFTYNTIDVPVDPQMPAPQRRPRSDAEYERIGTGMLHDQAVSSRVYAYFLVIPVVGLAESVYRFYLTRKFYANHGDPKYLWLNNTRTITLIAIAAALLTIAALRIRFYLRDLVYKRTQKRLQ